MGLVIDLFAGPGGWDVAMPGAVGIEHDASACATRAAAGHLTIRADVSTWPVPKGLTGLIASPPCPTFSAAGGRNGILELPYLIQHVHKCITGWQSYEPPPHLGFEMFKDVHGEFKRPICPDSRSRLVLEPLRFALEGVPEWIALEQVPDVLPIWEAYQSTLRALGWSVWCGILNSADFGVPQTRRRAILMAHRRKSVQPPEPTHCEGGAQTMFGELLPWVSMADALGWGMTARPCTTIVSSNQPNGGGPDPLSGGAGARKRLRTERDEGRWETAPTVNTRGDRKTPGGNEFSSARPSWCLTEKARSWTLHTNRGQDEDGNRQTRDTSAPAPAFSAKAGGQWAFERPAFTLDTDRSAHGPHNGWQRGESQSLGAIKLTVKDALTLQSFDPDYPVQGTKTKQFEQIGNAIPPKLAHAVLSALSVVAP